LKRRVDLDEATGRHRPPHGGRGLKQYWRNLAEIDWESPPARGARIETGEAREALRAEYDRPPHGGRGLKRTL